MQTIDIGALFTVFFYLEPSTYSLHSFVVTSHSFTNPYIFTKVIFNDALSKL